MKKISLLFIVIFFKIFPVFAWQFVSNNYTSKTFNAHPLIWNFTQDSKGRIWMANNDGVLRFDGNNWNLYLTPKPVRQIAFDKNGNLFLACEGDFGAYIFDEKGIGNYTSFKDKIGKINQTTLGEKKVFNIGGEIYFTSGKYIFKVENNNKDFQLKIIEVSEISGAFEYNGKLYINELHKGLSVFTGNGLKDLAGGYLLKDKTIIGCSVLNNDLLIATNYDGIYNLKNNNIELFSNVSINEFVRKGLAGISISKNEKIALATFNHGVKVFDKNGIEMSEINIPSNENYQVFFDQENNLWVAHRKGLTHVVLNDAVKLFNELKIDGNITDILAFKNNLFVSTSMGLLMSNETKTSLNVIQQINGECWQLLNSNNNGYIASTNGLFEYKNGTVSNLIPNQTIIHVQEGNLTGKLYAFGPEACYILDIKNNNNIPKKLEGLAELANSIYEQNNGEIWVGTYYNGLKKMGGKSFNQSSLPEELRDGKVIIRQYNGKSIFQSKNKVFVLNNNQFTEDENITQIFTKSTNKNFDFKQDDLVLNSNKINQLLNGKITEQSLVNTLSGKPVATTLIGNDLWIAFDDKIVAVSLNKSIENTAMVCINVIKNVVGNLLFDNTNNEKDFTPKIAFNDNSFVIEFSVSSFINPEQNLYRYKINGITGDWSDWKNESKIIFTGLSSGNYTLELQAKNALGVMSEKKSLSFVVLAPWYLTIYAYLIYGSLVILLIYLAVKINNKVLIKQNKKLEDTVNIRTHELNKSNIELTNEKKKSDDLLLNILPPEVADELKNNGNTKAKQFENVTIIFTDFVNFTLISEKLDPQKLVSELDYYFKGFDEIISKNGLEKIKTIGDAYLAVCGMPHETKDHAKRVIQAAKEIREFTHKRKNEGGLFEIRIGINSGPVIAGIVGNKKFAYDIWGDTVNTAARMEQNSEPGKINISESTYVLAKNDFSYIHRGKIKAKNKGDMDMYFVE
ncbi:MAG: adenylate/guanylate cyclase domain-containing protein [Bacteroidia bacterium]